MYWRTGNPIGFPLQQAASSSGGTGTHRLKNVQQGSQESGIPFDHFGEILFF